MKPVYRIDDLAFPIVIEQAETKGLLFTVRYGSQVKRGLTYAEACTEIGASMLHALCCDGLASNEGK